MRRRPLTATLLVAALLAVAAPRPARADAADAWWNEGWPYRVPVAVSGTAGVAQTTIDFSAAFTALGQPGALLDLRSLRIVPYAGTTPLAPVPHHELLSTVLDSADAPAINSGPGIYWTVNDGSLAGDTSRFAEGTGSLRATVDNLPGGYGYPGVEMRINAGDPRVDWRPFESLIYTVWPQVNASAVDQAPDLYWVKVYNTTGCPSGSLTQGGPPLALDQWNRVSLSLKPLDTCTTPNLSSITRVELHTRDNDTTAGRNGLWDDGDQLVLWLDDVRLVDQDGGRAIRWNAAAGVTRYYVYFDDLRHEGHPAPATVALAAPTITGAPGTAEAGGYLHQVTGASAAGLGLWTAPTVEKIPRTAATPVAIAPLKLQAAGGELEALQVVVRAPSAQTLPVSISAFTGPGTIPASAVSLFRVDYVTLSRLSDSFGRLGAWPDPLYPIAPGASVSFAANQAQPLWARVEVPRGATPGTYTATLSIGAASVPVQLQVWSFDLPPAISLASEWGFGWSQVVERWKGTISGSVQPCYWTLVDALYEDFARHRLTPKGVGWPAGLNYPGGVEYDCNGGLDPYTWGTWGFDSLADRYLAGGDLDNGVGFPSFLIRGPADNWPPNSRPSSFCGQSRGTDPPGNAAYNSEWFPYWSAVSSYVDATADYAAKGYYHIVNEPQTFADYDIVAYLAQQTKAAAPDVRIMVSEQVEAAIHANPTYPGAKIDVWLPTISNYESEKSHDRQQNHGESVWWYFLYGDRPPLPNPTVIDRPGIEARLVPWLAFRERVDGLLYYSTTDWSGTPYGDPWTNDGNGDGFLFYPPQDATVATDACSAQSNRLVPSIRWELLREGMEDYEYLRLLQGGAPQIGIPGGGDVLAGTFIASRTRFSRVPTDLQAARTIAGDALGGLFRDGFETGNKARWSF